MVFKNRSNTMNLYLKSTRLEGYVEIDGDATLIKN